MGLLTFSINVTLDGCVDHQEGSADDETHTFFTRLVPPYQWWTGTVLTEVVPSFKACDSSTRLA